jgi:hypothetical protein
MTAAERFQVHRRYCSSCSRSGPSAGCAVGEALRIRADREQPEDQRAIDQRGGRTYAEVVEARTAVNRASADLTIDRLAAAELRGAWLALSWLIDEDERPMPLLDRLSRAAGDRR